MIKIILSTMLLALFYPGYSQEVFIISGKLTEEATNKPMQHATIHLKGSNYSTLSKQDGSFKLQVSTWYDSLEISSVGFEVITLALQKQHTSDLRFLMKNKTTSLQEVVVGVSKKSGKSLIEKVIEYKADNNPSRIKSYSLQQYTRNELAIDQIDFQKAKGRGLKSLMLKTYAGIDSNAHTDKELPIYFSERLTTNYHTVHSNIDREYIIAKKNLGLSTDKLLSKLNKFYFHFNLYDDWIPFFDQTYASPLNSNAFRYYKFFQGESMVENGDTIQQIRFTPLRTYEKAFGGTMWINTRTLALETVDIHIAKNSNLNFVHDLNYSEDYKQVYDSTVGKLLYMPYKYISEVKFESGLSLLGIPVSEDKNSMKFIITNTTVTDKIKVNTGEPVSLLVDEIKKEQSTDWNKPDAFWQQNRPDSLTIHEQNIYKMVDTLKKNKRFKQEVKLVAFAGSGYWDFGNLFRIGPYSSFISKNPIEGWRVRLGFWTMPGINKKVNLFGYGAYGSKDQKLKGMLGLKYVWNQARWTKTTFSFGSDYDFIIDQNDELDIDNLANSMFRKNVPFTRMYVKQSMLNHEQYLSRNFSAYGSIGFKELNPIFDFKYRPINPAIDKPFDTVFEKKLSVAETSIGIRYAHKERTTLFNYDNIRLGSFFPVITAGYTFGFELGKAMFEYHKINVGIEQRLHLPPRSMLFYKLDAGKVFGTLPYLLLNIPAGNEYYVSSRYLFNTMIPYEFAADRYVSLHTRLYLGGTLFSKIPLLQKLGWRERFSFNAYWGDMTQSNIDYNKHSNFNLINKTPFMETGAGIENIFHVLSIEYYRRLNYLNTLYAKKDGIYLGFTLIF